LKLLSSLQGRPIGRTEWIKLKISAAALSAQVNRIEFDWSEAVVDEAEQDDDDYGGGDGSLDEGKEAGDDVENAVDEESPAKGSV
jgi:hypothetical protein